MGQLPLVQIFGVDAFDADIALSGIKNTPEKREQGGFAGAGRSDDEQQFGHDGVVGTLSGLTSRLYWHLADCNPCYRSTGRWSLYADENKALISPATKKALKSGNHVILLNTSNTIEWRAGQHED